MKKSNKVIAGKKGAFEYHLMYKCETDACSYETIILGRFDNDKDAFKYPMDRYHVDSNTRLARNVDIEVIYRLCGAAKLSISTDKPSINY